MVGSLCKRLLQPVLLLLILVLKWQFNQTHASSSILTPINKGHFPPGFVFGAGTSALQIEGAAFKDGRTPSIWDTFAHAGRIFDRSTGDIAADQYHKFKEDVKLMYDMGLDAYRFSISWSRLIPDGRGAINPKGLQYYNDLIDELVSYGIEAHVTLLHFDIPQALEDEYEGFLSPKIMFLDPLVYGDYPATMRKIIGSRLPYLSEEESKQLKGSFDYIGLNHYTVICVKDYHGGWKENEHDYLRDIFAKVSFPADLVRLDRKDLNWLKDIALPILPWGLQRLLEYIRLQYKNPPLIIHENGLGVSSNMSLASELEDVERVNFLQGYIEGLLPSLRNGSNVRAYFVWSFLDCFELLFGYTMRFGLVQVDYNDKDLRRYPRLSAHWYSNFLGKNRMTQGISRSAKESNVDGILSLY